MMAHTKILLLCAAVLATSACNKDSGGASAVNLAARTKPKAPVAPKPGPTAAEQTAGMVQAASRGKSSVPVELKFDIAQRPKAGQPLDITLALVAQIDASAATIQLEGEQDVAVASDAGKFDIPTVQAGEVYRETVHVTPGAEGLAVLGVTVSLKHDDVVEQRAFSIPIFADR